MSNSWTFSPSSEAYLQLCVAAAPPPDPNNKWFQKFGMQDIVLVESNSIKNAYISVKQPVEQVQIDKDATLSYEDFFDTIANEANLPLDYILQECNKNPSLIHKMSEKLSPNTIEQLFSDIFNRKDVETKFLTFITTFIRSFIKQHNSRLCIELLVKIKEYPQIFNRILKILINDTELPSQVLNNYISTLDEASLTEFMKNLSTIEITTEGFIQNVFMIYTAYKDCVKNESIQSYVKKLIIQHSRSCSSDRNFGRFFLTFLQTEKSIRTIENMDVIEKCLEAHRSPFKRPCFVLLQEITDNK